MMYIYEFYWDSELSPERKQEIVNWVNTLPVDKQKMLEELRADDEMGILYNNRDAEGC